MDNKPIGRRGVLALLGAAPFAAKQTAAEAANISVVGKKGSSLITAGLHGAGRSSRGKIRKKLVQMLLRGEAIPEYKRREWMDDAKVEARILDGDIASMRSVSLSLKIQMQTDRNYRRQVDNYLTGYELDSAWEAFKQAAGFDKNIDDDWDH